jgi:hypothetical protein
MELGPVIEFTEHLQIVTTSNYSAIANSHILQFTTAHIKSSQSAVFSPDTELIEVYRNIYKNIYFTQPFTGDICRWSPTRMTKCMLVDGVWKLNDGCSLNDMVSTCCNTEYPPSIMEYVGVSRNVVK